MLCIYCKCRCFFLNIFTLRIMLLVNYLTKQTMACCHYRESSEGQNVNISEVGRLSGPTYTLTES